MKLIEQQKPSNNLKELYGVILSFFLMLYLYSKFGPSIPFNLSLKSTGEPFIVAAEGKVVATNTSAKITIGIEDSGSSLTRVQDLVNKKSKGLTDALKIFDIKENDIKTTSYNIYPQQDYASGTSRIVGYQVSTGYEVIVKDVEKLNDILGAITKSGANTIGNISFDIDEKTKLEKTNFARELAVKNAKEKAEGLAKAAGVSLGKIVNVSESEFRNDPRPFLLETASGGDNKISNPALEPGTNEIIVNVTLSFEIR